jgi:hypothetical protein
MSTQEPSNEEAGQVLVIRIAPERAAELDRLAQAQKKDARDRAKEFLEAEIEAQHGLSYGPYLRKYMYR